MMKDTSTRLAKLQGHSCESVSAVEYEEPATDAIYSTGTSVRFGDGTKVEAQFWRLIKQNRPLVSIFDHRQRYGLPEPVDAISLLRSHLVGKRVIDARMDQTTGDLEFLFDADLALHVFNFTAFEIWGVTFPDGSVALSNYALVE
jgi:hypothetical protein